MSSCAQHRLAMSTSPMGSALARLVRKAPVRRRTRNACTSTNLWARAAISGSFSTTHRTLAMDAVMEGGLPVRRMRWSTPKRRSNSSTWARLRSSDQRIALRRGRPASSTGTKVSRWWVMPRASIWRTSTWATHSRKALQTPVHHSSAFCSCHAGSGWSSA